MNDVKHTALPWQFWYKTVFHEAEPVCRSENDANLRYIVSACNAYPALVEALEQYLTEWHGKPSNFDRKEPKSLTMARAALAQAQGE